MFGATQTMARFYACGSHSTVWKSTQPVTRQTTETVLSCFGAGTGPSDFDPTVFDDIPPAMCKKKGGAAFRIKCTDDGMPVNKTKSLAELSQKDQGRAHQTVPRAEYRGDSFAAMSDTLNQWLSKSNKVSASLLALEKC